MRRIAVIPARGGSKRLPRKNVLPLGGRPMIAHTISAALDAGVFDRVVVSTEDAEISAVSEAAGAIVLSRDMALAGDTTRVAEVCLDVLASEQAQGRSYDLLCCLYATAPLRNAADIRAVVGLVEPGAYDFAMAVTGFDYPPTQALRPDADGSLQPMWPDALDLPNSVVNTLCVDNGSTYAVSVSAFRRHRDFYGPGLKGWRMPRERSVDIDTAEDLTELQRIFANRSPA
jgi:CMP-N-acetylneuraminic acid synthetase